MSVQHPSVAQRLGPRAGAGHPAERPAGRRPRPTGRCLLGRSPRAPAPPAGPDPDPDHGLHAGREHLIGIARRGAAGDGRVPGAERVPRRAAVAHLRRGAGLCRRGAGVRQPGGSPPARSTTCAGRSTAGTPTRADQRNAFLAPWRIALARLLLWAVGHAAVHRPSTAWYDADFIPRICARRRASAACWWRPARYLFTEFALRPVAAQALAAGRPPRPAGPGHHGPHHDGVDAGLGRARDRHRPDGACSR